jgi:hypothetical protein
MNCEHFKTIVRDIERELDCATRGEATRHAESCALCARGLTDSRALAAGLRALAEDMRFEQSPPRLEAALVARFRKNSTAAAAAKAKTQSYGWARWAAAAAILILLVVAALRLRQSEPQQVVEGVKPSPQNEQQIASPAPAPPTLAPEKKIAPKVAPGITPNRKGPGRAFLARRNKKPAAEPSRQEITTSFYPLMYLGEFNQAEGGQMVRVELPRSALVSLGFPMNVERAGERVKADVIVGNDGLARAIRFVE